MDKKTKKIKKKIRFKRVFIALIIIILLIYLISILLKVPIKNIIIKGNLYLTDQEVIDIAELSDYPSIFKSSKEIKKTLEKNIYIKKASISKNVYREITIELEENKPLFYDSSKEKTILMDKREINEVKNVPILVNYVPDTIYNEFIKNMGKVDYAILTKISEVKYEPNEVDEERFLLFMNDQNKVYLTLSKFNKINNYNDIMEQVIAKYQNQKGILYLDEGEYFVLNKK